MPIDRDGPAVPDAPRTTSAPLFPATGRVMALDWGARRIGVAMSDATRLLATPLTVLTYRASKRLPLGPFLTLVEAEEPVGLVIGLALDDAGQEGVSAAAARTMAATFATRAALPVAWVDESYSTITAADLLAAVSPRRPQRDRIDAAAAAVLLQSWLDQQRR